MHHPDARLFRLPTDAELERAYGRVSTENTCARCDEDHGALGAEGLCAHCAAREADDAGIDLAVGVL